MASVESPIAAATAKSAVRIVGRDWQFCAAFGVAAIVAQLDNEVGQWSSPNKALASYNLLSLLNLLKQLRSPCRADAGADENVRHGRKPRPDHGEEHDREAAQRSGIMG